MARSGFDVLATAAALAIMPVTADEVSAGDAARGKVIAETYCARCHAVGPGGTSPLAVAPPFRTLGDRYPIDSLAEAFAEGIVTGHREMPQFRFEVADVDALLAYLQSFSARPQ